MSLGMFLIIMFIAQANGITIPLVAWILIGVFMVITVAYDTCKNYQEQKEKERKELLEKLNKNAWQTFL